MKKTEYVEIFKYALYGGITTLINLLIFAIFIKINMNYIIANIVSYLIAVIISFFFNDKFVFKGVSYENAIKRFIKYSSLRIFSIVMDSYLLYIFVEIIEFNMIFSKVFISFLIIILTYVLNKLFIFNKRN